MVKIAFSSVTYRSGHILQISKKSVYFQMFGVHLFLLFYMIKNTFNYHIEQLITQKMKLSLFSNNIFSHQFFFYFLLKKVLTLN